MLKLRNWDEVKSVAESFMSEDAWNELIRLKASWLSAEEENEKLKKNAETCVCCGEWKQLTDELQEENEKLQRQIEKLQGGWSEPKNSLEISKCKCGGSIVFNMSKTFHCDKCNKIV